MSLDAAVIEKTKRRRNKDITKMETTTMLAAMPQDNLDTLFIFGVLLGVTFLFGFMKLSERNRKA